MVSLSFPLSKNRFILLVFRFFCENFHSFCLSSSFEIMSARGLESDCNVLWRQFSYAIRLTLPSSMFKFFVALKKVRRKQLSNWMIAFVRLPLERMGVTQPIERSHALFILICWWKRRRDILSALSIWDWSNNSLSFGCEIKREFPKSRFNVVRAAA